MVAKGSSLEQIWQQWKLEHHKNYATIAEEEARKEIWKQSYHCITQHNFAQHKFFLALNQFSDMTDEEYGNSYLSAVDATTLKRSLTLYSRNGNEAEEIDWRERGLVSNGWQCVSKFCQKVATCLGYVDVSDGNENDLLNAVYTLGPVSVMVDAASYTFKYYKGGIYCNRGCSSTNLNQAMLVVGYGYDSSAGEDYWILKNSWGKTWGEDGYMRIARNRNNTCGVATLANYPILNGEWEAWKREHGKSYTDDLEESLRHAIWFQNYHHIEEHNKKESFQLGLNEFADLTREQFVQKYLNPVDVESYLQSATEVFSGSNITCPSSLDWRSMGFVTDIKNQGSCKSSWAFSATGALEGQLYKASRTLVSLSEQQLLDCSEAFGNNGCYGGVTSNAFTYVTKCGGVCRESSYPYLGYVNGCAANYCSKVFSCTGGYVRIQSANENALMQATYNVGPLSVVLDASSISFQYYTDGIYCDTDCNQSGLNHAMLVVGYGTDSSSGVDYWILKNSWGKSWGLNGYMKIVRGKNMCGIATAATYPLIS
ncbi:Cathepsin L [Geodia barretti]|uniref:Cathepsin L n=1 Tax=Geodia barretti TaxID=519541 RepID=A0AA35X6R9_GEOBA|nr:Cathepsin L [Geodia barretti]